jgi:phosphatidylserine decarboxylase
MRIPLTKYGLPQVVTIPIIIIAAMGVFLFAGLALLASWLVISIEVILLILLLMVLAFFRDPNRLSPSDGQLLLAPADGRITDIEVVETNDYIGGQALRIGIFLSVFDAHINRSPCAAKVEQITYKKGQYKDARHPLAGEVNESNEIKLIRAEPPADRLIVRQISGALARRIVCNLQPGQNLTGGEKFGMIKFGSRTELYLPAGDNAKHLVQVGDKVKAGITALIRYDQCQS